MKVVVVGASSGLGRCIGIDRGRRGDQVAFLARRWDLLLTAAEEVGPSAVAIACDVMDEPACQRGIEQAIERLSGIDLLVYAAGVGVLQSVECVSGETWRTILETNVIGASSITSAALPALQDSGGSAIYLSSVSASLGRPWPGLGAYQVSKAALDRLIEVYRVEHPTVRFTRVVVGDCGGELGGPGQSQFADGWQPDQVERFMPIWQERRYLTGDLLEVQDFLGGLDFLVQTGARVPTVWLTP
jgi:NAD(P)-dependent dehydrogenase (short-subunit alcohol dehydrogenase family)